MFVTNLQFKLMSDSNFPCRLQSSSTTIILQKLNEQLDKHLLRPSKYPSALPVLTSRQMISRHQSSRQYRRRTNIRLVNIPSNLNPFLIQAYGMYLARSHCLQSVHDAETETLDVEANRCVTNLQLMSDLNFPCRLQSSSTTITLQKLNEQLDKHLLRPSKYPSALPVLTSRQMILRHQNSCQYCRQTNIRLVNIPPILTPFFTQAYYMYLTRNHHLSLSQIHAYSDSGCKDQKNSIEIAAEMTSN